MISGVTVVTMADQGQESNAGAAKYPSFEELTPEQQIEYAQYIYGQLPPAQQQQFTQASREQQIEFTRQYYNYQLTQELYAQQQAPVQNTEPQAPPPQTQQSAEPVTSPVPEKTEMTTPLPAEASPAAQTEPPEPVQAEAPAALEFSENKPITPPTPIEASPLIDEAPLPIETPEPIAQQTQEPISPSSVSVPPEKMQTPEPEIPAPTYEPVMKDNSFAAIIGVKPEEDISPELSPAYIPEQVPEVISEPARITGEIADHAVDTVLEIARDEVSVPQPITAQESELAPESEPEPEIDAEDAEIDFRMSDATEENREEISDFSSEGDIFEHVDFDDGEGEITAETPRRSPAETDSGLLRLNRKYLFGKLAELDVSGDEIISPEEFTSHFEEFPYAEMQIKLSELTQDMLARAFPNENRGALPHLATALLSNHSEIDEITGVKEVNLLKLYEYLIRFIAPQAYKAYQSELSDKEKFFLYDGVIEREEFKIFEDERNRVRSADIFYLLTSYNIPPSKCYRLTQTLKRFPETGFEHDTQTWLADPIFYFFSGDKPEIRPDDIHRIAGEAKIEYEISGHLFGAHNDAVNRIRKRKSITPEEIKLFIYFQDSEYLKIGVKMMLSALNLELANPELFCRSLEITGYNRKPEKFYRELTGAIGGAAATALDFTRYLVDGGFIPDRAARQA